MYRNSSIGRKILLSFLLIVVLAGSALAFALYQMNAISKPLKTEIPQSIQLVQSASKLDELAQQIRYYDEVLTQSARNYAFTSNVKWKDRYNAHVPQLDVIIKDALARGDQQDKQFFSSIDASNLALIDMELRSIDFVDKGQSNEAATILESDAYSDQKVIYGKGLEDYVQRHNSQQAETIADAITILHSATNTAQQSTQLTIFALEIASVGILLFSLLFGMMFSRIVLQPIQAMTQVAKDISSGKLNKQVPVRSNDEIGDLTSSFNDMTSQLNDRIEKLQKLIK